MFLLACSVAAAGSKVVLRNDTNYSDTFEPPSEVAWLDYPECAISVLTPDKGDLPLSIDRLQLLFASSDGVHEGTVVAAEIGVQVLEVGEEPSFGTMEWGPELVYLTVANNALNEVTLEDVSKGLFPVDLSEGAIAVHLCTTDPAIDSWPGGYHTSSVTGPVIDAGSPNAGNWIYYLDQFWKLSDLGVNGAWVIRALAGEGSGDDGGGDDGAGDDGGPTDTGDTGDTGSPGGLALGSVVPDNTIVGEPVEVAIIGNGFQDDAKVLFGGVQASSPYVYSPTTIEVMSPSGLVEGVHDVTVEVDGDSVTLPGAFTVSPIEEDEDEAPAEDGCGCGASPVTAGWLALVGAVGLFRRRATVLTKSTKQRGRR